MRIEDIASIGSTHHPEPEPPAPALRRAAPAARAEDSAEISQRAREVQKAKDAILALPETREARIAEIRARLKRGEYTISSRDIADRMFDELTSLETSDEHPNQP
ncbi:MAG TPA: flagellar biosynthesis anti-sigma factor FlgM [Armatimonadota bacterium]|nr:flagellar biosynthesis anti-sigma factor FlgM [Armatimonadota bacterium]HOJ20695.1 flagellar biosynthesis anti-sigma factor FlgM [Armatimonadota bacterium]HOM81628.1 flagellar biosynthesis anti-sigma factor FlgM [Armatimonadota bacterium]HPO72363.1 flagellar biosynthesis anti-sigma factor FlgM [Armatimonadota bacterium]HPT99770.1 flagellar biosynthesis anti-sigma factor FlgM [Armatimonadota bacterium]